jgi:oligopeptide/dipeptide ABC transporter ATP-binding protein
MMKSGTSSDHNHVLRVQDLRVTIAQDQSSFEVVSGVDFSLYRGRTLGIVGESGCGKSMTSFAIMNLLPKPVARISGGQVLYGERDLCQTPLEELYAIRGNRIAMIFQEPMSALNPVMRVGEQVAEVLLRHGRVRTKSDAMSRVVELFESVGIPAARDRIAEFPHRLSGGMRQRVMIAMALACEPDILIADEPTTALDVTIQAQILHLMDELKSRTGMAVLLVSHDLGLIAEYADELAVMYAGEIVEAGPVTEVMQSPKHPYTQALMRSRPDLITPRKSRLATIEGAVPHASAWPTGCRFHPRCSFATEQCKSRAPQIEKFADARSVRCWHWRSTNG